MNSKITNFAELERFIKEHPEEKELIEEAYFYLREKDEDQQMETQGQVDPFKVPVEFLAQTALALAFRNRIKTIEEDKDYQDLVKKHKELWLEKNNAKNFDSKEGLDYLYGSLEDEGAATLKKDAEQEFRENPKFKGRAGKYDREKKKVYKNIDEDPAVIKTRYEIENHTRDRHAYLKTHEDKRTPEEISALIQKRTWGKFVAENPEKAKTYAQADTDIKKAHEKQDIKKQLAEMEQRTGKQVRYVEKTHRPQDITVEEASQRLQSIIPTPPRPTPSGQRTSSPQTGRFFDRSGRIIGGFGRQFGTQRRQGTRIITQAGKTIGRIAVRSLFSNPMVLLAIGIPVAIGIAVFIIIMLEGGGGFGKGNTIPTYECLDVNGNRILVTDGNACAQNYADYYTNQTNATPPITARCLDKCTDPFLIGLVCDRNPADNLCNSLPASCGAEEHWCFEYSIAAPRNAKNRSTFRHDCSNTDGFDYGGLLGFTVTSCNVVVSTPNPTPTPTFTPTPSP